MTKEEFEVLQLDLQQSGKSVKDYLHEAGVNYSTIDNNGNSIPSVLVSIMKRCLLKCPKKRFSSACEIIPYLNSIDFEHRNENDSPRCMR